MLAVTSEAGRSAGPPPAIRSRACGTDAGMEREEESEREGGGGRGRPLCPQLSEPANDSSQGGCCKGTGKLKQTPRPGAATCVAARCHSGSCMYALLRKHPSSAPNVNINYLHIFKMIRFVRIKHFVFRRCRSLRCCPPLFFPHT